MSRAFVFAGAMVCAIASRPLPQSLGSTPRPPMDAVTHDNREPAGTRSNKVLKLRMEVVRATWRPEGA